MSINEIESYFKSYIGSLKNVEVLDVGCGDRHYEDLLDSSAGYVGIDVKLSGRPPENKMADHYFDGINIPFPKDTFDVVICNQVLEHAEYPEPLVKEMNRVLKENGIGFFTVPFIWGEHEIPYDFRRYSSFGIKKLCKEQGFEVKTFKKITQGADAVELLIKSEINCENKSVRGIKLVFKRVNFKLIHFFFAYLKFFYPMARIYQNNLIVVQKI